MRRFWEICLKGMDWINLAHDRKKWRILAKNKTTSVYIKCSSIVWIAVYVLAGEGGISSMELEWRTKTRQKLRSQYDVTQIIFSLELVHSISAVDPGSWEGASGSETYIKSSLRFLSCTEMLVVNKWMFDSADENEWTATLSNGGNPLPDDKAQ